MRRLKAFKEGSATTTNTETHTGPTDSEASQHYAIGQTDRSQDAVNIPRWVDKNQSDEAVKFFIPQLKQHLLSRLSPTTNPTEIGKIMFQGDRMYSHATLRLNYTSYDVRRQQDVVRPTSSGHSGQFIMLPADPDDDTASHPFLYAKVLGIYHAKVAFSARPPKRMDFLWVRWLNLDEDHPSGWGARRLDRVSYGTCRNTDELLDAFGFVDPSHVIRSAHLIPEFRSGYLRPLVKSNGASMASDDGEGDWKHYCVNRFADRDMVMRYLGGGIGHFNQRSPVDEGIENEMSYEIDNTEEENNEPSSGDLRVESSHAIQAQVRNPNSNAQNESEAEDNTSEMGDGWGSEDEGLGSEVDDDDFIEELYEL
ncbi:hypothetical protein FRC07_014380 [Ceratobasidium sp. 392]|nr:hypothetical protein FRC07_014380 [Ceratobasidium sp. 392]